MQSISLIATNVKPYYRAAQASLALKKYTQSLQFIAGNDDVDKWKDALFSHERMISGGRQALKAHFLVEDELKLLNSLQQLVEKEKVALEVDDTNRQKVKQAASVGQIELKMALKSRDIVLGPAAIDLSSFGDYEASMCLKPLFPFSFPLFFFVWLQQPLMTVS